MDPTTVKEMVARLKCGMPETTSGEESNTVDLTSDQDMSDAELRKKLAQQMHPTGGRRRTRFQRITASGKLIPLKAGKSKPVP